MPYLDYSWAMGEACRCLLCDDPPCHAGCPAGVNPKRFIRKVRFGNLAGAVRELKRSNILAASCSYICPCLETCGGRCTSEKLDRPIDIIGLQRFVCEWERKNGMIEPVRGAGNGARVAIVGAGPAGLACAAELAVMRHVPVIFDKDNGAGGMLRGVIPNFRLPLQVVDFEIEFIKKLGVSFEFGKTVEELSQLFNDGFKAVFVATGLSRSKGAGLIGEDKKGVCQALEFLRDAKTTVAGARRVVVIGGGDTALDAARSLARAGASVVVAYRRTRRDMPAYRPDIAEAEKEGVEFLFRTLPRAIIGTDAAQGVRVTRIRWNEGGRLSAGYSVEGSEFTIPCDAVILAIGQESAGVFGLRPSPAGYIAVDKNMMTSQAGVFAGGDIVTGPLTAVAAVGAGKQAAGFINKFLKDVS